MTKVNQDIDKKVDQQKLLLLAVRDVLKKHSLTFSEQGVRSILKVIKSYQSSLIVPSRPTKSLMHEKITELKDMASKLSTKLQELQWHIVLEDPPDSLQLRLNHLMLCCEQALTHSTFTKSQNGGRPLKALPLKFLVQRLILIFEEETDENYVIEESSTWSRERTVYNRLAQAYVKSILRYVAPGEDHHEALKAARREPIPLNWVRGMKKSVDEDFRQEAERHEKDVERLRRKIAARGTRSENLAPSDTSRKMKK